MSERQPGQNPEQYPQLSWGHALMGALEQMTFSRRPTPEDGNHIAYFQREFRMADGAELHSIGCFQGLRAWDVYIYPVVDNESDRRDYGFTISQMSGDIQVRPHGSAIPLGEETVESLYRSIVASVPVSETQYLTER